MQIHCGADGCWVAWLDLLGLVGSCVGDGGDAAVGMAVVGVVAAVFAQLIAGNVACCCNIL